MSAALLAEVARLRARVAELETVRAELTAALARHAADPTGWAEVTRGMGSVGPACPYCTSHRRDEHGHCAVCGCSL